MLNFFLVIMKNTTPAIISTPPRITATIAIAGPDGTQKEVSYAGEGVHAWDTRAPYQRPSLPSGRYLLTFSDGVESLVASFLVPSEALILFIK